MWMSERLEEIKDDLPLTIREYPDVEKLIEYVEELEEDKGNLSNLNTEIAKYSWNLVQEIKRYKQAFKNIDNAFNNDQFDNEMFIAEVEDVLISLKKGEPQ